MALRAAALALLAPAASLCLAGCGEPVPEPAAPAVVEPGGSADDPSGGSTGPSWREVAPLPAGSCGLTYDADFAPPGRGGGADGADDGGEDGADDGGEDARWEDPDDLPARDGEIDRVAHAEPPPASLLRLRPKDDDAEELTLPRWDDTLPLFERATAWDGVVQRCYETPLGALWLTEGQAYEMYVEMAEATTGSTVDATPGARTVVGVRGAYPGSLLWHGNEPDRWNDTLALLWIDESGAPRVREFPATLEPGAHDFGYHNASTLRPNRRYRYLNGTHRDYDALRIDEEGYEVRDDTNHNGHWDSDRNGWLPPTREQDHFRLGSLHNIHGNGVDADVPLGQAPVGNGSAGCQVIPGTQNYAAFITSAWTGRGDVVWHFLLDARDVAPEVFRPCEPDGSHGCPFPVGSLPASFQGDTGTAASSRFDRYSCAAADESGPEQVWVLTLDRPGTLTARVTAAAGVDVDVHLLDADDARACLARHDVEVARALSPGRYFLVVDTYVPASGRPLSGAYALDVGFL